MKKILAILFLIVFFWSSGTYAATSSGVTVDGLVVDVRRLINETGSSTTGMWTNDELRAWVNYAVRNIISWTRCTTGNTVYVLDTGTSEYPLADDHLAVKDVVYQSAVTTWEYIPRGNKEARATETGLHPKFYYETENWIGFYPLGDKGSIHVTGNTAYVTYARMPSTLTSTDTIPTPAYFDPMILYFAAHKAILKDGNLDLAKYFDQLYKIEVLNFKEELVYAPKELLEKILRGLD